MVNQLHQEHSRTITSIFYSFHALICALRARFLRLLKIDKMHFSAITAKDKARNTVCTAGAIIEKPMR